MARFVRTSRAFPMKCGSLCLNFSFRRSAGAMVRSILTARLEADLVLVDFSLLPDWRGRGIGGAVLQTIQTRAQAASCGIRLQVAKDNPDLHLYARHGFATFAGDELRYTMHWDGSHESLNGTSASAEASIS
ncbi:hypothetical protein ASF71_21255 [Deinococcus sp. Leaf326]|nr:hypothetical protein ASF71_21255 [Deinococcus sp. Leaf326]